LEDIQIIEPYVPLLQKIEFYLACFERDLHDEEEEEESDMARGRKKKSEIVVLEGNLRDSNVVQKSKPLFSLWASELTLQEFKILDTYLSRINSHNPEMRTVIFSKGELESLLGVKKLNQSVLDERLKHLMGYVVRVDNPKKRKGYALISLFEKAYCEKDEYGLWTVELECTQSAMEYFFNIEELGYLRYKIRSVTMLRSLYSYILFTYLEYNRFRKSWTISIDDLKDLLNCKSESYSEYKEFNRCILKRCYTELTKKTDLRYTYETVGKDDKPVKRGCKAYGVRFTLETLSDSISVSSSAPIAAELPGQMSFDSLNNEEKEIDYGSELGNLLGRAACDDEFSPEEIRVIQDLVLEATHTRDHMEMCDYLIHQVHKMNLYNPKREKRFNYLCKMINSDIKSN
jgi:hypothetical protein